MRGEHRRQETMFSYVSPEARVPERHARKRPAKHILPPFLRRPDDGSGSGPGPGRNSERNFHGEKRSNDTHASQTDPEARLYRKSRGQGAQLCYQSHLLMENRNGLIVDHELTPASGTGERTAAVEMVTRLHGNHRPIAATIRLPSSTICFA
jgi:hypothetical protein